LALTVDHVRYVSGGRLRQGVGSSWLAERTAPGRQMRAFVQRADHFRPPQDGDVPIIMVGPGTGIAPFRAFLQERAATGARGGAWLFYGHQHEATDYFYREELVDFRRAGVLGKLSLAWSRDGAAKIYVQDKMAEAGEEIWDWLYDGAYFYVCGDAAHMAPAVEDTLVRIVAEHGNRDEDAAVAYVEKMKRNGRYQADVY
jgi:sulfite reductase (NADPH) flavoprotein alpha-component